MDQNLKKGQKGGEEEEKKKRSVVNAAFLFFETSKLWALIMYFVE